MILVDANLLLYAYDTSSAEHHRARGWWEKSLSEPEPARLAWTTILAFLRIGTNPRSLRWPMTLDEATGHVTAWLERPMVAVLEPTDRHLDLLRRLLVQGQATANLAADGHLAALSMEHGATLCSTDEDFSRFRGLSWRNPLRPQGG